MPISCPGISVRYLKFLIKRTANIGDIPKSAVGQPHLGYHLASAIGPEHGFVTGASFKQQHPKANFCHVLIVSINRHYQSAYPAQEAKEKVRKAKCAGLHEPQRAMVIRLIYYPTKRQEASNRMSDVAKRFFSRRENRCEIHPSIPRLFRGSILGVALKVLCRAAVNAGQEKQKSFRLYILNEVSVRDILRNLQAPSDIKLNVLIAGSDI